MLHSVGKTDKLQKWLVVRLIWFHLIYINAEGVFHPPCSPLCDVCQCFLVNPGILHMERVLALEEAGPGGVQPVLVIHLGLFIATVVRVFLITVPDGARN